MIRISVTGPESTGKSWLAEQLALHYQSPWVPEYAREYLAELGKPYRYPDIEAIARGQYNTEKQLSRGADLIFADTDFLVTFIWSDVKYKKVSPWIAKMLRSHQYDLYLLCNVDLPWQFDPLREHPEMRSELFEMYRQKLDLLHFNYKIVNGLGDSRLDNAIHFVEKIIKTEK